MADPLDYLLPPRAELDFSDPEAIARWIAESGQSSSRAIADDDDDGVPEAETSFAPQGGPQQGAQQGAQGSWGSWLQDRSNRSFLMNFGLQLMSGGWGGWSGQLASAIAAGAQGAHATERESLGLSSISPLSGRERTTRGPRERLGPRGRGRVGTEATRIQAERAQLEEVAQFLQRPDVTEAEWNQEAGEGGLIHRALGPGQQFGQKNQLLVQVQQRLHQLPRRGGTVTSRELLRLGQSQDPQDLADFEILARQVLGNPGVGNRWIVTPEGRFDRQPLAGGGRGPGGGSGRSTSTSQAATAAMQQGLTALDDIQQALSHTSGLDRAVGNITGMGVWGTVEPQLEIVARALMHGLSGAQVSIPETQAYLRAFKPDPSRLADWSLDRVNYRLNHARLLLLSILQGQGQPISEQLRLTIRNAMRVQLGLSELTMEQHMQSQQSSPGLQPPPGVQQPPPVIPAPPTPQQLDELKKRYGLE